MNHLYVWNTTTKTEAASPLDLRNLVIWSLTLQYNLKGEIIEIVILLNMWPELISINKYVFKSFMDILLPIISRFLLIR